jgi:hypothetical protein
VFVSLHPFPPCLLFLLLQLLAAGAAGSPTFASAYEERVKVGELAQVAAATFGSEDDGPIINDTMKEALKVVFSKDGSYAQEVRQRTRAGKRGRRKCRGWPRGWLHKQPPSLDPLPSPSHIPRLTPYSPLLLLCAADC